MVQIAHSGLNEEKVQEILVAAQIRFGMYGYSKTAMHEIADDLGISKASLYYYFPDKDSLFREVFKKEKQEFIDQLHVAIAETNDAKELLLKYIELRLTNFKSFINISRAGLDEIKGIKNVVKDLWINFIEKEKQEIRLIFEKGIEKGDFNIANTEDTAELFLDALRGISHIYLYHKDISYINEEEYSKLNNKIKQFTNIFIKGILA